MRKSFVYLIVFSFISMIFPAYARGTEGYRMSQLKPFKQIDFKDLSICEYTYKSQWEGKSGLYDILGNVEGIYIHADSDFYGPEVRDIPFFQSRNLATLSACTLEKLDVGIPVYVPQLQGFESFYKWPALDHSDQLTIKIFASLQRGVRSDKKHLHPNNFYHDVDPGKLVIINVSLYRHGVNDFRSFQAQDITYCSRAFEYTKNHKKLHILLTDAIHQCLEKPFYSGASVVQEKHREE